VQILSTLEVALIMISRKYTGAYREVKVYNN